MARWVDTEVSLLRSWADPSIWSSVIPGAEVAQTCDSAARLRRCKEWTIDACPQYGIELGDRVRWRKISDSLIALDTRVEDDDG